MDLKERIAGELQAVRRRSLAASEQSDLDRVFDPVFRGEAARTPRSDGGAGLGLAIARGIVEAHGGTISVHNQALRRIPFLRK